MYMIIHNKEDLKAFRKYVGNRNAMVNVALSKDGFGYGDSETINLNNVEGWMANKGLNFRQTNLDLTLSQGGGDVNALLGTLNTFAQTYPYTTAVTAGTVLTGLHPMDVLEEVLSILKTDVPYPQDLLQFPLDVLKTLASALKIPGRSRLHNKKQYAGAVANALAN